MSEKVHDQDAALAEYYDTHSTADEMENLELVEPASRPMVVQSLRFDADTVKRLRRLAADEGMSVSSLMRHWVEERLAEREGEDLSEADEVARLRRLAEKLQSDVNRLVRMTRGRTDKEVTRAQGLKKRPLQKSPIKSSKSAKGARKKPSKA